MKNTYLYILCFLALTNTAISQINWLQEGDNHLNQLFAEKAVNAYTKHIAHHPNDALAYIKRAQAHGHLGQTIQMEYNLNKAKSLNPYILKYVDPLYRNKLVARKSFSFSPNMESPFSKSASNLDAYNKSITNIESPISDAEIIVEIIESISEGRLEHSYNLLRKTADQESQSALLHDLYGLYYYKKGNLKEAITHFTKAISINPEFSIAHHNRGVCYKLIGNKQAALTDFKTAILIDENISLYHFSLAKLYEITGQKKEAKAAYHRAISIRDDYYEALNNYGILLNELGDTESSLDIFNKLIASNTDKIEKLFEHGNIQLIYGDYENAINNYSNYLDYHHDDYDALFNRGLAYILLQKLADGCSDIRNSLDIEYIPKRVDIYDSFCEENNYND